jgi:type IV pilus assembly protein PilB
MSENKSNSDVGTVLQELGRISREDIDRALEHQRLQGCYFGESLIDLGILDREELNFSLESRANLPYVVPDADNIEADVAALVPLTWAQRHNALPIRRKDGWLTLLVDSPFKSGLAEELARRTGLSVELALSSSHLIRNAIRKLFKVETTSPEPGALVSLESFWTKATSPLADRWGLTVRQNRVTGWLERDGHMQRFNLIHSWLSFLDQLLSPPPSRVLPSQGIRTWRASVHPGQSPGAINVTSLSGPSGDELLFVPVSDKKTSSAGLPDSGDLATLRDTISRRPTIIAVSSPDGHAARQLVTRLPSLLLNADHRSVCLLRKSSHSVSDTLVMASTESESDEDLLELLEKLALDAIGLELIASQSQWDANRALAPLTMDLEELEVSPGHQTHWQRALALAQLTLLAMEGHTARQALPADIDWILACEDEDQPSWELRKSAP